MLGTKGQSLEEAAQLWLYWSCVKLWGRWRPHSSLGSLNQVLKPGSGLSASRGLLVLCPRIHMPNHAPSGPHQTQEGVIFNQHTHVNGSDGGRNHPRSMERGASHQEWVTEGGAGKIM